MSARTSLRRTLQHGYMDTPRHDIEEAQPYLFGDGLEECIYDLLNLIEEAEEAGAEQGGESESVSLSSSTRIRTSLAKRRRSGPRGTR